MTTSSDPTKRVRPWVLVGAALVALAGTLVGLGYGWPDARTEAVVPDTTEPPGAPPAGRPHRVVEGGIPPRPPPVAPTKPVVLPRFDGRDDLAQAADDARDLVRELAEGDRRWEGTLVELLASDEVMDAYWSCSKAHLRSSCHFGLRLVLVPEAPGRGVVGYGRTDEMSNCPEYADCMVRAFVGRSVPLPDGLAGPVGYRLERTDNTLAGLLEDPERLRRTVEALERDLAGIDEADAGFGQPDWHLRVAEHRARLRLLRRILDALDD